ncbi:unnamed protein product [Phyllotreta striolata]|uniref:Carboxylic ester hydrolase n=1 Tax=Phyllotreta striolata TaxID=444603 RepID=A0A9N9TVA4_PHYSR|nr:unnamed protein product [Phyllotreta striolata]
MKSLRYSVLIALLVFGGSANGKEKCPWQPSNRTTRVFLPDGVLQGHVLKSWNGNDFFAWQEIPYAAPPVNANRFRPPKEPLPWRGTVRNATKNTKVCMQYKPTALTPVPDDLTMSEDCLFLNVYSPVRSDPNELMPILFFIHGGGFFYGSGAMQYYDPKYLMDYGVIVVTINYRLGPLGFLTTQNPTLPANNGLRDQLQALKWTIKNICAFGGDPNNITVMGESAGSTSAGFMQLSPLTKGMVQGYIMDSGSPLSPYAFQERAWYYAFKLARLLNKEYKAETDQFLTDDFSSEDVMYVLRSASAENITNTQVDNDDYKINPIAATVIWLPVADDFGPDPFVDIPMEQALMQGSYNQVPLMTGMTSEEAMFFLKYIPPGLEMVIRQMYDANVNLTVHPHLRIACENETRAGREYKEIYTNASFVKDRGAFVKYLGEEVFATPNMRHAELASAYSSVYLYEFAHKGSMGGFPDDPDIPGANRVGHTEELHYLWGGAEGVKKDPCTYPLKDQLTMKRMLTLWTNFVKYQNPTPEADPLFDEVLWPRVKPGEMNYLMINDSLAPSKDPKNYKRVKEVFEKYKSAPYYSF